MKELVAAVLMLTLSQATPPVELPQGTGAGQVEIPNPDDPTWVASKIGCPWPDLVKLDDLLEDYLVEDIPLPSESSLMDLIGHAGVFESISGCPFGEGSTDLDTSWLDR